MKTAISIPDSIFQAAEQMARQLGISRSELYAKAMSEYIETHKYADVTESLNKLYSEVESKLDEELGALQFRSVPKEEWQ